MAGGIITGRADRGLYWLPEPYEKPNLKNSLNNGLQVCWLFNTQPGPNVPDLSGNNNTGTFTGTSLSTGYSQATRAWDLNLGSSDRYVQATLAGTWNGLAASTVMVHFESMGTQNTQNICQFSTGAPANAQYQRMINFSTGGAFEYMDLDTGFTFYRATGPTPAANTIYCAVATQDTSGLMTFFANGVKYNVATNAGGSNYVATTFNVGYGFTDGGTLGQCVGRVMSAWVWNRALSDAEATLLSGRPYFTFNPPRKTFSIASVWASPAITGVAGTGGVGSGVATVAKAITGVTGTSGVGSVSPTVSKALTGVAGTSSIGAVSKTVTPTPGTIWNASSKSTNAVISGSNLTLAGTGGLGIASSNTAVSGKKYWEITLSGGSTFGGHGYGIANATFNPNSDFLGGTGSAGYNSNTGGVFVAFGNPGTIFTSAPGDVVGIAVDTTAGKIWWRKNGGSWDNTTDDPATGTGGYDISSISGSLYAAASLSDGDTATANFGASAFGTSAPSGFSGLNAGLGVAAIGGVGTVSITASASKALTGAAATSGVGTISKTVNPTLTGVSATGSAGSVSFVISPNISITGVAATSGVGTVVPSVAITLATVAGSGAAGTVAKTVTITLASASGTGSASTLAATVTNALASVSANGAANTPSPIVNPTLASASSTGNAGSFTPSSTITLASNAVTGSAGTFGPIVAVTPASASGTGAVGSLALIISPMVSITGVSASSAIGTVIPTVAISLIGVAASGAAGSPSIIGSETFALTGASSSGSAGTVTPIVNPTLNAVSSSGVAGSFAIQVNDSSNLVGVSASGSANTFAPVVTITLAAVSGTGAAGILSSTPTLATVAGNGSVGSFTPSVTISAPSVAASSAVGALVDTISITLSGTSATCAVGSSTPAITVAGSSAAGAGAAGSLASVIALTLPSASSTGSAGSFIPVVAITLAQASATGAVGSLNVLAGTSDTIDLAAVTATAQIGSIIPTTIVALLGNAATGQAGSFGFAQSTALPNVTGDGAAGSFTKTVKIVLPSSSANGAVGLAVGGTRVFGASKVSSEGIRSGRIGSGRIVQNVGTQTITHGVARAGHLNINVTHEDIASSSLIGEDT